MNLWILKFFKILPILTFIFTLLVLCVVLVVDNSPANWFMVIFLLAEIYFNWIAIHLVNSAQISNDNHESNKKNLIGQNNVVVDLNSTTSVYKESISNNLQMSHKPQNDNISSNVDIKKIWYCSKCLTNTPSYCHHCPLCNKCIILRDHHCFFLGACICMQNMKYFIVLCLYVSIASLYVDFRLFPYLCKQTANEKEDNVNFWYMLAQCFFPVALSRWLLGDSSTMVLLLVSLFDILMSAGILTLSFGLYQLFFAVLGKNKQNSQRLDNYAVKKISRLNFKSNFSNIFGNWGILNFLFPVILGKEILKQTHLQRNYKYH